MPLLLSATDSTLWDGLIAHALCGAVKPHQRVVRAALPAPERLSRDALNGNDKASA